MVVDFIQVFSYLGKSSIFGNLHFDWHFHIDLGVDAHLNPSFYLYYSSGGHDHLASNFAFDLLPAHIAYV